MEAILATHDATRIQVAERLGFRSDDPNLRSLALRAYLENVKKISFAIELPPAVQAQADAAQSDPDLLKAFNNKFPYTAALATSANAITIYITKYSATGTTGTLSSFPGGGSPADFSVTGDRFSSAAFNPSPSIPTSFCTIEFRPSADLTFRGTLSCQANGRYIFPKLAVSSPIF
jgi:hypothetical protein